jgi:hypothetical protein
MRTRSLALASCLVVLAACSNPAPPATPAPAPTPPSAAGGFFGWWEIPDIDAADDARGGAMLISPEQISNISKHGRVTVLACHTEVSGTSATITGCGPPVTLTLDNDRLTLSYGFDATRATPARAAELDEVLAVKRPPADACDRALACLRDAGPLLHTTFDPVVELGDPPNPTHCADTVASVTTLLTERKQTVPVTCQ